MINPRSALILLMIFLGGCTSTRDTFFSGSFSTSLNIILDFLEPDQVQYTSEFVEGIPYASSLISFEGDSSSLIILETQDSSGNFWMSADEVRFKELNGRIIQTIGLPNDLYSLDRPVINFNKIRSENQIMYYAYYSFRKPHFNKLKVAIDSKVIGKERISILGRNQELILIEETFYAEAINWRGVNKYWVDPNNNFVWKSLQNISPKLPELQIQVTKKPAQ